MFRGAARPLCRVTATVYRASVRPFAFLRGPSAPLRLSPSNPSTALRCQRLAYVSSVFHSTGSWVLFGAVAAQLWTFLPLILQFGMATEEIDIDMLAEKLQVLRQKAPRLQPGDEGRSACRFLTPR